MQSSFLITGYFYKKYFYHKFGGVNVDHILVRWYIHAYLHIKIHINVGRYMDRYMKTQNLRNQYIYIYIMHICICTNRYVYMHIIIPVCLSLSTHLSTYLSPINNLSSVIYLWQSAQVEAHRQTHIHKYNAFWFLMWLTMYLSLFSNMRGSVVEKFLKTTLLQFNRHSHTVSQLCFSDKKSEKKTF